MSLPITCNADFLTSPPTAVSSASASANKDRTSFSLPPTQRSKSSGVDIILGARARKHFDISRARAVFLVFIVNEDNIR